MAIRVLARRQVLQITLIPLQKIQSFSNIPTQIPQISSQTTNYNQQISVASTLQRYGFPQSQIHEFITKNRILLNSSSSDTENCIKCILSFGITQKDLIFMLNNCPGVFNLRFLEEWKLAFSKLGFCSSSVIRMVLQQSEKFRIEPHFFCKNAEAMKEKFRFSDKTLIKVFEVLPAAFMKKPVDVSRRIDVLIEFGVKMDEIDVICCTFPEVLAFGVDGRLRPLFKELGDLRFKQNEIKKVLTENPKIVLGLEVGEISKCMELIKSLKCRVPINEKILSNGYFRAGIDVKVRIDYLCKLGLIRRDAFKILYVEPRIIIYELEDIEKKIDFLVQKMGFTIEHIVEFPDYLGVNLEKQIIPRFNVIEHLKSIGGLCFEVELKHFVRLSRMKFYNLYVKPYPECEKIFGVIEEKEVRPRHPHGLWKMFKPSSYPDTKEDVRNIKMFVESLVYK